MTPNITTGADFAGLVKYLTVNRDHEVLHLQGVSSIGMAAAEMAAVAALNGRASVVLIHLSISAAREDGVLSDEQWIKVVDRHERAFKLTGHQRVMVRHYDKLHDHVHVFWCTISARTAMTPPKSWFLRKGHAQDNIGTHALTEAEVVRIPVESRALRSYDFRLLPRAQDVCRTLERELHLRRLRTPGEAAAARLRGEGRAPSSGQEKRAERTGSSSLMERADEIRMALEEPDWPSKQIALNRLGLDLKPSYRTTAKGRQLAGLVIFESADSGNRIKASQLDGAQKKYGLGRLEERHETDAVGFERWWGSREPLPFVGEAEPSKPKPDKLKARFDVLKLAHQRSELEKREKLADLRRKQKREVARKRRELMLRRASEAAKLPAHERRQFYGVYDRSIRAGELSVMSKTHEAALVGLTRSRAPSWLGFLEFAAEAGDTDAAQRLQVLREKAQLTEPCREELAVEFVGPLAVEQQWVAPSIASQLSTSPSLTAQDLHELSADELYAAFMKQQALGR